MSTLHAVYPRMVSRSLTAVLALLLLAAPVHAQESTVTWRGDNNANALLLPGGVTDTVVISDQQESVVPASVVQALVTGDEPHALWLHAALVAYNAAQGADLSTTMFVIGSGKGVEGNPVAALFIDKPVVAGMVKMGVAGLTVWGLIRLHRTNPKTALVLAVAGTIGYSAVAVHNARVGQ